MSIIQEQYAQNPQTSIFSFYDALNTKQYDIAFGLLSPEFRERVWGNDAAKFAKGYYFTQALSDVTVTPIAYSTAHRVFYKDEIKELQHPDITALATIETEEAAGHIALFKQQLVEVFGADPQKVAALNNSILFGHNAVEVALYLTDGSYEIADATLQKLPKITTQARDIACVYDKDGEGFQISGIKKFEPTS